MNAVFMAGALDEFEDTTEYLLVDSAVMSVSAPDKFLD